MALVDGWTKAKRKALSKGEYKEFSDEICHKVLSLEEYVNDDKIMFFESREKAKQFERDIRFLDDVAYRDDYKKKVLEICEKYKSFFMKDDGEDSIEMINQCPISVEYFDC